MTALVLHCNEADFDAATQTCAAPYYSYPETPVPTLSIADAQAIGMEIALLFAIAWTFRVLRKALNEIG